MQIRLEDCWDWATDRQAEMAVFLLELLALLETDLGLGGVFNVIFINGCPYILLSRNAEREACDCYWGKHWNR